ncbi:uncharacterized protein LOC122249022 isoform X2 [Penaeus japonicus]|uniref:uncharacterized protein LOC122249022 isoform X2 n=1 Tax=Penaeus japonicus TaxID=27405 RepID=UPI001C712F18|nr:uncharacterized protein LOC122249022 isoform X2 [Penaeus japonicus]
MSDSESNRSISTIILLLTLASVSCAMLGSESNLKWLIEMSDSVTDNPLKTAGDVDNFVNEVHDIASVRIAKHFSASVRRHKRDLDRTSANVTGIKEFAFNMSNPSEFSASRFEGITAMLVLGAQDKDYLVLGYSGNATNVLLERAKPGNVLSLVAEFTLPVSYEKLDKLASVTSNGTLWIAMGSSQSGVVSMMAVDLASRAVEQRQILKCNGVVGALHMFEAGGRVLLVLGADGVVGDVPAESRLYRLEGQFFNRDHHVSFETSMVSDITGFRYRERKYYLVIGSSYSEGTCIYEFNILSGEVWLVYTLHGSKVYGILHYEEKHEMEHYIVTLSKNTSPKIYRCLDGRLSLWQVLSTETLIQEDSCVQTFTLDFMENILILTTGGKITMYRDDIHANMVSTFATEVDCSAIEDLSVMNINGEYVMAFICENQSGNTTLMFRSIMVEQIKLEKDSPDIVHGCISELKKKLGKRQAIISELEDILRNNRLLTTDTSQSWTRPISFIGELTVNGTTTIQHTVNITRETAVPNVETIHEFNSRKAELKEEVMVVQSNMLEILYHSKDQVIKGPAMANSITADLFESNALKIRELNGAPLLDIESMYFLDGQDQNASSAFFHTMRVKELVMRGESSSTTINGFSTNQYMRKSLTVQEVTGCHTYANLKVGDICGSAGEGSSVVVNAINTSSIVSRNSNVTFVDQKTFQNVEVFRDTNILLINDVDLSSLAERLVYKNLYKTHVLEGNYTLDSVSVSGNVDVATVNNVDMIKLYQSVVKTSGNFMLLGNITYQTDLRISGSTNIPKVNGITWDDIVCDASNDVITGLYRFTNVSVRTAIICSDINGIKMSKDVMLVDGDEATEGRITFSDDITVTGTEGVVMTPSAIINSIDPRNLLRDNMDSLTIKSDCRFTNPLKVFGNLTVPMINRLRIDGLQDRYWTKGSDQLVPSSLRIESAVFKAPVTGKSINYHQMENYLNVVDQQSISGKYVFQAPVTVHSNVNFLEGITINGVDVSALKENVVFLEGDQIITAPMNFSNLTIEYDLRVGGKLNGWNVSSDLMRLDRSYPHIGSLTFTDKTTATLVKMMKSNLTVRRLNRMVIEDAVVDIVLRKENATINGSLLFKGGVWTKCIEVKDSIDGIDMEDLVRHSLKKVSEKPQSLTGLIRVNEGVSFMSSLELRLVNSKNWTKHLMKVVPRNYSGIITGKKKFHKPVSILGDFNPAIINYINMSRLVSRILTSSTEQTIHSKYFINGDINTKDVTAPRIDGVDVKSLLLVDEGGYVPHHVLFKTDVIFLNNVTSTTGILDGCNILKLNRSAIYLEEDRVIEVHGPVTINRLLVKGDVIPMDKVTAGPNDLDLLHFLDTLVEIHGAQDITGKTVFATDIRMSHLSSSSIDGIDINHLYSKTVFSNRDEVINCNIEFTRALKVNELTVRTSLFGLGLDGVLVDGLNVTEVKEKAVLTSGGLYHITGRKMFSNNLTVTSLRVADTIGNVSVQNLVVVSQHDRLINNLLFTAPITVSELQVDGLIDGVDLEYLLANRITTNDNGTISRSLYFEDVKVEGDLVVNKINNISLSNIVFKSGRAQQTITGWKTLNGGLAVMGSIEATVLNGVDLTELSQVVVRKDREATLGSSLTFEKSVEVKAVVEILGTVNGQKLSGLKYNMSTLANHISNQSTRLNELYMQLENTHSENLKLACGLYMTMSYGEEFASMEVDFAGKMTFGLLGENKPVLALRNCDIQCSCNMKTTIFSLGSDGSINRTMIVKGRAVFLFEAEGFCGAQLIYQCTWKGGRSILNFSANKTKHYSASSLGFVSVVKSFTVERDGINKTYIVTAGTDLQFLHYGIESYVINVMRRDENRLTKVWSKHMRDKIVGLDITNIFGVWCMLIASFGQVEGSYAAPTRLYKWDKEQKFRLYQQLRICEEPIDLKKVKAGVEEMMLVSCRNPYKLISFRFHAKGFSYT